MPSAPLQPEQRRTRCTQEALTIAKSLNARGFAYEDMALSLLNVAMMLMVSKEGEHAAVTMLHAAGTALQRGQYRMPDSPAQH